MMKQKLIGFAVLFALVPFMSAAQQDQQAKDSGKKSKQSAATAVTSIQDANGDEVGNITGVVMDNQQRQVRYVLIKPRQGQQERDGNLIVPISALKSADDGRSAKLAISQDKLAEAPRHKEGKWNQENQARLTQEVEKFYKQHAQQQARAGEGSEQQARRDDESASGLDVSTEVQKAIEKHKAARESEGSDQQQARQSEEMPDEARKQQARRDDESASGLEVSAEVQKAIEKHKAARESEGGDQQQARQSIEMRNDDNRQQAKASRGDARQDQSITEEDLDSRIQAAIERHAQQREDRANQGKSGQQAAEQPQRQQNANQTISGTVEKISAPDDAKNGKQIQVTVKSDDGESFVVDLGPQQYMNEQDLQLNEGDSIVIVGRMEGKSGQQGKDNQGFVAQKIWKTASMLELRDEQGQPRWQVSSRDR
jgi:hypothetical protein